MKLPIAAQTQRSVEEVLSEWLTYAATDPPVELLSDEQILQLADLQMDVVLQEEMSALLVRNREGQITSTEQKRLDELLHLYQLGMVRKAHALKVAVERGLRPYISIEVEKRVREKAQNRCGYCLIPIRKTGLNILNGVRMEQVLHLDSDPYAIIVRKYWVSAGWHPPSSDSA